MNSIFQYSFQIGHPQPEHDGVHSNQRINICDGSNRQSMEHNRWYCGQMTDHQYSQSFHPTICVGTMSHGEVNRKRKIGQQPQFGMSRFNSYPLAVFQNVQRQNSVPHASRAQYFQIQGGYGPGLSEKIQPWSDIHRFDPDTGERSDTSIPEMEYGHAPDIEQEPQFSTLRVDIHARRVLHNVQTQSSALPVDMSQGEDCHIQEDCVLAEDSLEKSWPGCDDIGPIEPEGIGSIIQSIVASSNAENRALSLDEQRLDLEDVVWTVPATTYVGEAASCHTTSNGQANGKSAIDGMIDGSVQQISAPQLYEPCTTITPGRPIKTTQSTAPEVEVNYDSSVIKLVNRKLRLLAAIAIRSNKPVMGELRRTRICDEWDRYCEYDGGTRQQLYNDSLQDLIVQCTSIEWTSPLSLFFTYFEEVQKKIATLRRRGRRTCPTTILNRFSQYCVEKAAQQISNPLAEPSVSLAPCPEMRKSWFPTLLIAIRANTDIMNALADIKLENASALVHSRKILGVLEMIFERSNHVTKTSSLKEFVCHFEDLCKVIQNHANIQDHLKHTHFRELFNFIYHCLDRVIPQVDVNHDLSGEMCKYPNLHVLTATAIRWHEPAISWFNTTSISDALRSSTLKYATTTQRRYEAHLNQLIKLCGGISLESSLSIFFTRLEDLENIASTFGRNATAYKSVLHRFNDYCLKRAGQKISDFLGKSLTPFSALSKHGKKFSLFPTLLIAVRANTKLMNALATIKLVDTLKDASHDKRVGCGLEHIFLSNHVTRQCSLRDFVSHLEASCAGIQNAEKLAGSTKREYVTAVLNFTSYLIDGLVTKMGLRPPEAVLHNVQTQSSAPPVDMPQVEDCQIQEDCVLAEDSLMKLPPGFDHMVRTIAENSESLMRYIKVPGDAANSAPLLDLEDIDDQRAMITPGRPNLRVLTATAI